MFFQYVSPREKKTLINLCVKFWFVLDNACKNHKMYLHCCMFWKRSFWKLLMSFTWQTSSVIMAGLFNLRRELERKCQFWWQWFFLKEEKFHVAGHLSMIWSWKCFHRQWILILFSLLSKKNSLFLSWRMYGEKKSKEYINPDVNVKRSQNLIPCNFDVSVHEKIATHYLCSRMII